MKIKFLVDYIGRETAMKQYNKGDMEEMTQQAAIELIQAGIVEEVEDRNKFLADNFGHSLDEPLPEDVAKRFNESVARIPKRKVKDESDKQ